MNKIATITLASILLTGAVIPFVSIQSVDAMKGSGQPMKSVGNKDICGDRLCSEWEGGREGYEKLKTQAKQKISEKISELEREGTMGEKKVGTESEKLQKQLEDILAKIERGERLSAGEIQIAKKAMMESAAVETAKETYGTPEGEPEGQKSLMQHSFSSTQTDTITSVQDPGIGHETHQLAVILPPSDNVYVGRITFSASEPVQFVALHGPLKEGEDKGQPIWTPDGKTKFALTLVDNEKASGGWYFAGNALALHSMHETPFTATYSVAYAEVPPGVYPKGTVASGTVSSSQDPGLGHESHQLAIILPPREIPYQGGVLAYSASENVHLVALIGPLSESEIHGQQIWTPDGKTKYALTLVDPGTNMGVWTTFSGNALALHTSNPDGFTASYTIAGLH
jgi:hypothetical protein